MGHIGPRLCAKHEGIIGKETYNSKGGIPRKPNQRITNYHLFCQCRKNMRAIYRTKSKTQDQKCESEMEDLNTPGRHNKQSSDSGNGGGPRKKFYQNTGMGDPTRYTNVCG